MRWVKRPRIYEIDTWVWLHDLSIEHGQAVTLGTVPPQEWDRLAALGADAVWLMGVWERSPAGIEVANQNPGLQADFQRALADFQPDDNVGSAYCVRDYVVDARLGGTKELAQARTALATRGMRLILDFVPNHVAPDHPWVTEHPDYFIRGTADDLHRAPAEFFAANDQVIANGRDPYFAPWPDVAQLNAFDAGLRAAAIETVSAIAAQCDGMRCDMAMLLLNDVFHRTWGERAGALPTEEYWSSVISAVRARYPDVIFIAEAYWDLEWQLQQHGFDYCYDKRLYDRLAHESAASVRGHLQAELGYQERLVRFIENHDEPRAAEVFSREKERAAAVVVSTLPGACLYYDGQFEGRRIKLPVFLARRADETPDAELREFYQTLLAATHTELMHQGEWRLCEQSGWSDNQSVQNLVAWCWTYNDVRQLVVVNLSDVRSQGRIGLPWSDLGGRLWRMRDPLNGDLFERQGETLESEGFFVDLDRWAFHLLNLEGDGR